MEPFGARLRVRDVTLPTQTAAVSDVRATFDTFYAATYARLVAVLSLTTGDRRDAEDVVQEAFVRLLPRWSAVSRYEDPEGWVRSVAGRLAISRWRKAQTALRAIRRLGPAQPVPGPDADVLDVVRLLSDLTPSHRQVLVLHHALGLSVEEIA